jgi:hypothetical protein
MSEQDALGIGRKLGKSDPIGLESPIVRPGFDPGLDDRIPKQKGDDTSMPDTRMGLRNEARTKVFMASRDKDILDDKNIL